ncbi:Fe(3+)-citrate-binding protein YfmC precursor [Anaerotignum neopropionicum]|uniref:Fe(3+)-citrate-binding protein YfmC n=1 Tax=Anaerotignum neopropionicum TaxID=36847 RepID=A0A136WCI1_9FIRM|nr:ABC transporter substrate-binding protein [Anaerotignum neopropionicum]KXL52223.1 Fe(3+)-citrate-binding protein YfmC precursor [Anaerotignum neopropionicum]
MKKVLGLILAMSLALALFSGCANASTQKTTSQPVSASTETEETKDTAKWPRTITDAAGHEVFLDKQPERITLLHSYYMEDFLALGTPPTSCAIGNSLGQTEELSSSEMFAPYLKGVEIMDLGSAKEINLEAILESAPDVIVTFAAQGGVDENYDQLVQIAPVVLLDYTATWQNQLLGCAEIVGKETKAQYLIAEIEEKISDAKKVAQKYPDRTFVLFRTDSKGFITRGNAVYYETFGLTRSEGYPDTYETISLEAVTEMDPYYIVFQHNYDAATTFVESMKDSSVWQSLDAVKNGRIYYFDENMNTFGPLAMNLTAEKLIEIYTKE